MKEIMKDAFWESATFIGQELIIPITALVIVMSLFYTALFGGRRQ